MVSGGLPRARERESRCKMPCLTKNWHVVLNMFYMREREREYMRRNRESMEEVRERESLMEVFCVGKEAVGVILSESEVKKELA